LRSLRSRQWYK